MDVVGESKIEKKIHKLLVITNNLKYIKMLFISIILGKTRI